MNAAETKQLASELEASGFAKAVIDQALQKVPKHLKSARAAEWCFDWILNNPEGEKAGAAGGAGDGKAGGAAAKPNGAGAGAGAGAGGAAMVDDGDPLAEIVAMGFSRDAARIAMEEQGDVGAAINALLQDAERIEAEAHKQREAKKAADEKAAKEAKAKQTELQRAARLKVLHSNIYRTVCGYRFRKADPTKEDTDRVQAIFALSTLYEPVEEELAEKKKNPPAPAAAGAAAAGAGRGKPVAGKPAAAAAAAGKPGAAKDAKSNGAVAGSLKSADCTVCRSDWDADTKPVTFTNCGHSVICTVCLSKYVAIRVRDKDVLPWIPCSAADCKVPLAPKDIVNSAITTPELYALLSTYCAKMLARESQWVECATKGCGYGFWLEAKEVKELEAKNSAKKGTGFKTDKCAVCSTSQKVSPKTEELDNEFKKMIAEGKLRPCPKCALMTMKEYGVCNVLECAKCGVWWNWRSRETGRTSKELKDRARMKGTLWEAGELEFQQRLERTNHAEFVKLLERNGVKYDPNYHRGT